MRSNKQNSEQLRQLITKISPVTKKLKDFVTLGLDGKQWLASLMICLMLLPLFALPVGASVSYPTSDDSSQFEPVNEKLPVWTETWRNLNAKIESWTTPLRSENSFFGENDDDKKKKKTAKDVNPEETTDKKAAEEKTAEKIESKSDRKAEPNSRNAKFEKETSKSKADNGKTTNLKNKNSITTAPLLLNQLPDDEKGSIYNYENNLGAPPGQTEMDSSNQAAALRIRHRVGIANFSFGIPLAGLSGRGINAGVGMAYNSRTWNKSVNDNGQDHFTYDVEQSWIAPGFSSGLGYLETAAQIRNVADNVPNNHWHTEIVPLGLTDPDGTRHQLSCKTYTTIYGTNN